MIEGIWNTLTVILFWCGWVIDPFVELIREIVIDCFEAKTTNLLKGCSITLLLILSADGNTYDLLSKMKYFSRRFKSTACNDAGTMNEALIEEFFVDGKDGHISVCHRLFGL